MTKAFHHLISWRMKKSAHLLVDDEHWGDFIKGDSEDFQAYKIKWIAWFEIKLRLVFAL